MVKVPLKQLLQERGQSMYGLAKGTGIAYTTLWKLDVGDSQGISFEVLEKICQALDCTPSDVLVIAQGSKKSRAGKS